MVLLGACRIHGNVEMAKCIAKQTFEMKPENDVVKHLCYYWQHAYL
jgi:hypothetical protein